MLWQRNILPNMVAVCADYQYMGYPKHICVSINDVVCHGIPNEQTILQEGDIVNVDATTMLNGYYADASRMFMIGKVSNEAKKLVSDTKKALELGMASVIPYQVVLATLVKQSKHLLKLWVIVLLENFVVMVLV